ncbi:hypothetical protein PHYPSEUDO_012920 [Phytophthora pseudosyringae]|uniref:PiggyBac transposable element-derived protein domain-containing protein n=1 Tax=Phytophthora pseudosyringae TaxID=221518 RepID=A0A8T1V604_9STRA|nr:hypothetical protein PHYPSEUDO_012920 [Phytophthora pseudosyringae]
MSRPQVGNRVWGKSKKHAGKRGVVLQVLKESRQYTYEVKWSTGVVNIVAARSIALEGDETCPPDPASGSGNNDISFLGLLGSSTSSLEADCWSSSLSSDDEEDNEDEVAESDHSDDGDDEIAVAHGRQWVSCDSILVDQAAHIPPRSTRFLWPPYLQIGDCSLVKYFYLMYPMSTVNETIRLTNINLGRNSFRHIGQGDFFRWMGIRLAMAVEPRRGPSRVYWESDQKEGSVNTPANYGDRFQMSRHCFEQIYLRTSFCGLGS